MLRRLVPLAVVVGLAVSGASAEADRGPTKRERAGVAKAVGAPARCVRVRVSTVNRRYASALIRNGRRSCRRWAADGVAVFRRGDGRWRFVTAGSAFECPVPKVPRRVARDLGIRCYDG